MMFLGLRKPGNICCGHKMFLDKIRNTFCVPDTKFVSATNVRVRANGETFVSATMCPQQCVLVCKGFYFCNVKWGIMTSIRGWTHLYNTALFESRNIKVLQIVAIHSGLNWFEMYFKWHSFFKLNSSQVKFLYQFNSTSHILEFVIKSSIAFTCPCLKEKKITVNVFWSCKIPLSSIIELHCVRSVEEWSGFEISLDRWPRWH